MIWIATIARWLGANWKPVASVLAVLSVVWWHYHAVSQADEAGYRRGYNLAKQEDYEASQTARDKAQAEIDQADKKHTEENEIARVENESLRANLRSARIRLSVRTIPASNPTSEPSISPGVDNGSARSDIDPRDAEAIVAITGRGDEAIRQLTAAQDVIRSLVKVP